MKNLIKLFAMMVAIFAIATTSAKGKKEITTTTFITTIDCASCVKKVMNVLPFQKGVKSVDVDLDKKSIKVDYDKMRCSIESLKATLKRLDVEVTKEI